MQSDHIHHRDFVLHMIDLGSSFLLNILPSLQPLVPHLLMKALFLFFYSFPSFPSPSTLLVPLPV